MKGSFKSIGVIIGNRDFFPDFLVGDARKDVLNLFAGMPFTPILPGESDTKLGGVETLKEAVKCAGFFKAHREDIGGILVVLPNFGDEKGVADTIKMAGLNVPVLIQAYPDDLDRLDAARRRDAYCGKISVCNNLKQAGIPFSLTTRHTVRIDSDSFRSDFDRFLSVCRVVRGIRGARIGAIGARPGAFNTVRYSEKILERNGINVTTRDLSELIQFTRSLASSDPRLVSKLAEIKSYLPAPNVPEVKLLEIAKIGVFLDGFVEQNLLDATAIQCWTSLQQNLGCNACTNMSMMSESLLPSACEVDVTGALSMMGLQLASACPSALVDWNNNYADDDDKCVLFHCGNWAKSFIPDGKIATAPILGTTVGEQNTFGALDGRTPAAPLTLARITTDDVSGKIKAYVAEGILTNDELKTFGNRAVAQVKGLNDLMHHVCRNGFEHHVAITCGHVAGILKEAFETYFGWEVHHHRG
jgi:L-fucose isomerase-like protein